MKAMLSQPMADMSYEEIVATHNRAVAELAAMGYEVENTLFSEEWNNEDTLKKTGIVNTPLHYLAKSIERMSKCHAILFCKGWDSARGCRIEHEAAKAYGLHIYYE